jgi:hypothetical protein
VIEQLDVGSYNLFGAHREESAVRWSRLHKRRAKGISPAPGAEHTKLRTVVAAPSAHAAAQRHHVRLLVCGRSPIQGAAGDGAKLARTRRAQAAVPDGMP